jgi:hypothetical protein
MVLVVASKVVTFRWMRDIPIELRAGLGVRVGDGHAFAPITSPIVAGLHVLD